MAKNFYIQGDPSRAKEIKAAFEKLGIRADGYDFSRKDVLFFTFKAKGKTYMMSSLLGTGLDNIILTHPDYQELELPVEHILKVGDWVVPKSYNGEMPRQIVKKLDTVFVLDDGTAYICEDAQKFYRLWMIEDAKDGDVLVTTKIRGCPFIYRKTDHKNNLAYYYVGIDGNGNLSHAYPKKTLFHFGQTSNVVPATKEQHDLFFAKIKEAGYQWDDEKKELKKIPKHYDIDNFKPKQWVLVRDDDEWEWALTRFSYLSNGSASLFVCINGASFQQCIPYNEDTKHLLGTTDMPSEEYINW